MTQPDVNQLKQEPDVDGLIQALKHESPYVSAPAARALGEPGDPRAVDPLIDLLDNSWLVATRGCAIDSLGDLGETRAIPL